MTHLNKQTVDLLDPRSTGMMIPNRRSRATVIEGVSHGKQTVNCTEESCRLVQCHKAMVQYSSVRFWAFPTCSFATPTAGSFDSVVLRWFRAHASTFLSVLLDPESRPVTQDVAVSLLRLRLVRVHKDWKT